MKKTQVDRLGQAPSRPPGRLPKLAGHAGHGSKPLTSVRETTHRGHSIVITTTYSITVDGRPLNAHVDVDELGRVHYHGLPNYNFPSAVDMVKAMIDADPSFRRSHHGGHH